LNRIFLKDFFTLYNLNILKYTRIRIIGVNNYKSAHAIKALRNRKSTNIQLEKIPRLLDSKENNG